MTLRAAFLITASPSLARRAGVNAGSENMCGRFTLRTPQSQLVKQFGLTAVPELAPRYNIAPTQEVVAVRAAADGQSSSHAPSAVAADGTRSVPPTQSDRELVMLRWGLIPPWADDPR